mmetsp:Transcript_9085/g.39982  ORF Transcript_9085/g.39982 Transcript_9085/m.39982 type:complete len:428 (-) Transcript_9085:143-1426(-)
MDCDEATSRFLLLLSLRSARVHQVDADDGHSCSRQLNFIQRLPEEQITKQRREHRGEERERAQLREASLGREVEKCPVRQRGTQEGGVHEAAHVAGGELVQIFVHPRFGRDGVHQEGNAAQSHVPSGRHHGIHVLAHPPDHHRAHRHALRRQEHPPLAAVPDAAAVVDTRSDRRERPAEVASSDLSESLLRQLQHQQTHDPEEQPKHSRGSQALAVDDRCEHCDRQGLGVDDDAAQARGSSLQTLSEAPLERRAVDEGKNRDGEPRHTPRWHRSALGRRPCDEHRAGGHQPHGRDEERTCCREHLLHGHHGRAPQEEGRHERHTAERGEDAARGIVIPRLLRPVERVSLVLAQHARHVGANEHALKTLLWTLLNFPVRAPCGPGLGSRVSRDVRAIFGRRRAHRHAAPTSQTRVRLARARGDSQPQR